jgi:hypothetical protein
MAELPAKLWVIVRRGLEDSEVVELHVRQDTAFARAVLIKAASVQPGEVVYVVEAPVISE